ncbi:hypothetical protein Q4577_18240 [Marinovum sp. 2_MG-2023]|uniref:hypothetical protein n=1 Tax=unclassified Marinovum TaxID=2647166 RepID=UPI0026E40738|nr:MULTISPECIES: hypothetical protein [unclassified Marinovum]MDO6731976.1 hypothetical protein [Marinovum sp. 2_MG-2023]MDO6781228.1 hypothetical protein [Marinovum sp. 1_MG-2023]
MVWKLVLVFVLAIATFNLIPNLSKPDTPQNARILDEIAIDGPAIFYEIDKDLRRELWSVDCRQPLRGCVARAPGLVLRVDDHGAHWLIAASHPGARKSVQTRNYTRDTPEILSRPLSADTLAQLSQKNTFLVIEEQSTVVLRAQTTGIAHVAGYLAWINSETARTLRDARLWPKNEPLQTDNMTPDVLERYQVMQRRRLEAQRQLVPATKPQIEFAVRAQSGDTFYSPNGRAGY